MSRAIQRLVAFAIVSSILLTSCGGRPVSVSGLHAVAVEEGQPSTLVFKLINPTPQKIVLTSVQLDTLYRDMDRNGEPDPFAYSYRPEIHRYVMINQVLTDEIALEVILEPGQIIEFKRSGNHYVKLEYFPPEQNPQVIYQKGLPHGYLMSVKFFYSVISQDPEDKSKEIRTSYELVVEGFID